MTYMQAPCDNVPQQRPCGSCRTPFPGCDEHSCSELSDWLDAKGKREAGPKNEAKP